MTARTGAPALYATAPTPGAAHETTMVEAMARMLGTPLMPWQSQVARVVTERSADGRGWRWPTVVLTVPRQSGKTTLMRAVMAQRTLRYPMHQAFYTAQSGKDARARWRDLVDVADMRFPQLVTIRRGAGAECMEWRNGHGQVRVFAPTRKALHGYTPPLVMMDEAFAYDEDLGAALMGAVIPAQATLADRQVWIVSTAGDAESTWLRSWVERGREAVGDPMSAVAYFEWSAPDGLDLGDPASFELFHPAVGFTQTTEMLVAARDTMSRSAYERAFGNRWTTAKQTVVSAEALVACTNTGQVPPEDPARVTLGFDVAPDRSAASVWAAWSDQAGAHLRPYFARSGTAWLAPALSEAAAQGMRLAADDGGPARSITARLRLEGIEVSTLSARDFASATGDLIEAVQTGRVDHPGDPGLLKALDGAALRCLGEADAWSRRDSVGPVHELIAATVALRAATYTETAPAPLVIA